MSSAELLIATGNAGKLVEFQSLLGERFVCTSAKKPIPEVEESGISYFENALAKAVRFFDHYRIPCLADDSGLEVDALGGQPGIYSARFGGEALTWPERWEFLYGELGTLPLDHWTARFRCVLCFHDGVNVPRFFEGTVEGRIAPEPRGSEGFGYDPLFYCDSLKKSFGEASFLEKQKFSHRAAAVRSFLSSVTP